MWYKFNSYVLVLMLEEDTLKISNRRIEKFKRII